MVKVGIGNKLLQERLTRARKNKGYTQLDVYQRVGINNKSLSAYETGKNGVDYEDLEKLAKLYGVTVDYLMGRTNDPHITLTEEESRFIDLGNIGDEKVLFDGRELSEEEKRQALSVLRALLSSGR